MSTINIKIPESLHKRIKIYALEENISINQFIASALAEKLSALDTEIYLNERSKLGDQKKYRKVLAKVSERDPQDYDI